MSYEELRWLGVTFRPIDVWPGPPTPAGARQRSPFSARFSTTVAELARELRALHAKRTVVQLALNEADFRNDGLPKVNARAAHPGVVIAFESKWGPLKYATDRFWTWQENLRAVALSMEALRKVDRYGVASRGEQYQGWKALPRSTDAIDTREQAWHVITEAAGIPVDSSPALNGISEGEAIRRALLAAHPDRGGDVDTFRRVVRAREVLEGRA